MAGEVSFFTIILFFVYTYGLGFTLTAFVRNSDNFLERSLMRIGVGLGVLPFLGIILSLFHVPIDWRIFLALSLLYPLFWSLKNYKSIKFNLRITNYDLLIWLMLLIFLFAFYMYHKGAFAYPYLEDDDPWSHAIGIKFVTLEKTVFPDIETASHLQYLHPYPPSYDLFFGLLHQTSSSLNWTMKFFNALIISLSIIFFFFFVRQFTNNKNKALFASFILAMMPAYLSHFIWAIALTMPLYFVAFYCLEKINEDKKWFIASCILIASTLTISPSHSTYFGFFFLLYLITKTFLERKFLLYEFLGGIIGITLSFIFWWGQMLFKYGLSDMLAQIGIEGGNLIAVGGTGDRPYILSDFLFAKSQNLINSPIGIGIVISILTIGALVIIFSRYKKLLNKENHWIVITVVWFLFTLYAVNGARFPIRLSSFRVWPLFAIPVSIISAEGINYLLLIAKSLEQQIKLDKVIRVGIIILLIAGIWFTSGKQKFTVNTALWPAGQAWVFLRDQNGNIRSPELEAYLGLKTLPINTKVFSFSNDGAVLGLNKFICAWCKEVFEFRKNIMGKTGDGIYSWLKGNGYEYAILGQQEVGIYGLNETNGLIQKMLTTERFQLAGQTETTVVLRVV